MADGRSLGLPSGWDTVTMFSVEWPWFIREAKHTGENHQYRPQFVKSATAVFRLILLNVSIREDYLLSNNST